MQFGGGMAAPSLRETVPGKPSRAAGRVLIADDQHHILFALQMLLSGSGFSTETVTHPSRVLRALETKAFDAVLIDLNYTRDTVGGAEGLELVSKIRSMDSLLPVVVMTAWSSVDLAVEAMRRGASDFVQKPWENRIFCTSCSSNCLWLGTQRQIAAAARGRTARGT